MEASAWLAGGSVGVAPLPAVFLAGQACGWWGGGRFALGRGGRVVFIESPERGLARFFEAGFATKAERPNPTKISVNDSRLRDGNSYLLSGV